MLHSSTGLVVWINSEVGTFLNTFCRQLFGTQAHLSAVSNSVAKLRGESKQVGLNKLITLKQF